MVMASGGNVNSSTTGLILEHFLLLSGSISHIKAILDDDSGAEAGLFSRGEISPSYRSKIMLNELEAENAVRNLDLMSSRFSTICLCSS